MPLLGHTLWDWKSCTRMDWKRCVFLFTGSWYVFVGSDVAVTRSSICKLQSFESNVKSSKIGLQQKSFSFLFGSFWIPLFFARRVSQKKAQKLQRRKALTHWLDCESWVDFEHRSSEFIWNLYNKSDQSALCHSACHGRKSLRAPGF